MWKRLAIRCGAFCNFKIAFIRCRWCYIVLETLPQTDYCINVNTCANDNKAIVDSILCLRCALQSPFPADFVFSTGKKTPMRPIVNMLEEDRATDIGNMHKNLVKVARMITEISSRTDRQTHRQTYSNKTIVNITFRPRFCPACELFCVYAMFASRLPRWLWANLFNFKLLK